ncbi:MAG: hypothetical protein JWO44_2430 [Bacteroidetes bacterium]|nr:hypothetical protein [Bacteroidota bacterium]
MPPLHKILTLYIQSLQMKTVQPLLLLFVFLIFASCNTDSEKPAAAKGTASGPLTCTLTSDELVKREAQLKEEIFSKVKDTKELEDGFEFSFHEDAAFAAKLVEFINLERDCCPFFTFTLTFAPKGGEISVKIGNSKEIKEMLRTEMQDMKLLPS